MKSFYKSKTFWFNLLALLVLIANAFGFQDFQASPEVNQGALVIITIINLILRFVTTQPIGLKDR